MKRLFCGPEYKIVQTEMFLRVMALSLIALGRRSKFSLHSLIALLFGWDFCLLLHKSV